MILGKEAVRIKDSDEGYTDGQVMRAYNLTILPGEQQYINSLEVQERKGQNQEDFGQEGCVVSNKG